MPKSIPPVTKSLLTSTICITHRLFSPQSDGATCDHDRHTPSRQQICQRLYPVPGPQADSAADKYVVGDATADPREPWPLSGYRYADHFDQYRFVSSRFPCATGDVQRATFDVDPVSQRCGRDRTRLVNEQVHGPWGRRRVV